MKRSGSEDGGLVGGFFAHCPTSAPLLRIDNIRRTTAASVREAIHVDHAAILGEHRTHRPAGTLSRRVGGKQHCE